MIQQIEAIGTVTLESEAAIEAARAAYDALTEEQQALVSNYETLTAAEQALEALLSATPETGDTMNFAWYVAMMLVSLMGVAAMLYTSKRKCKN